MINTLLPFSLSWMEGLALVLLSLQLAGLLLLFSRAGNTTGRPKVLTAPGESTEGMAAGDTAKAGLPRVLGGVSIVVPTLNEARRIGPCLAGLARQQYPVREILVVDSRSTDGTRELVERAALADPRIRLLTDDPLPEGWVGRPWALHYGFRHSAPDSEWILGIDADTEPQPDLVVSLVARAQAEGYDLVSLAPRFVLRYPGECLLHPALLTTLIYRTSTGGPTGTGQSVLANGQCFLCRRQVLEQVGGYTVARASFSDDVTLARKVAAAGFRVEFLDGVHFLKVRMYEGVRDTWHGWGRSLDLKESCTPAQLRLDLYLLLTLLGLPLPTLLVALGVWISHPQLSVAGLVLTVLNALLLIFRLLLLFAISPSHDRSHALGSWFYWLSPLADPLAVLRVWLSAFDSPRQWRGRQYPARVSS